jgi:hypothetical protein
VSRDQRNKDKTTQINQLVDLFKSSFREMFSSSSGDYMTMGQIYDADRQYEQRLAREEAERKRRMERAAVLERQARAFKKEDEKDSVITRLKKWFKKDDDNVKEDVKGEKGEKGDLPDENIIALIDSSDWGPLESMYRCNQIPESTKKYLDSIPGFVSYKETRSKVKELVKEAQPRVEIPHVSQVEIPHVSQVEIPHVSQVEIPHVSQVEIPVVDDFPEASAPVFPPPSVVVIRDNPFPHEPYVRPKKPLTLRRKRSSGRSPGRRRSPKHSPIRRRRSPKRSPKRNYRYRFPVRVPDDVPDSVPDRVPDRIVKPDTQPPISAYLRNLLLEGEYSQLLYALENGVVTDEERKYLFMPGRFPEFEEFRERTYKSRQDEEEAKHAEEERLKDVNAPLEYLYPHGIHIEIKADRLPGKSDIAKNILDEVSDSNDDEENTFVGPPGGAQFDN